MQQLSAELQQEVAGVEQSHGELEAQLAQATEQAQTDEVESRRLGDVVANLRAERAGLVERREAFEADAARRAAALQELEQRIEALKAEDKDKPGLIGFIGTICGKHNVNISHMSLGRADNGGDAVAVLNLDGVPSEETAAEILAHAAVTGVDLVALPKAGKPLPWLDSSN